MPRERSPDEAESSSKRRKTTHDEPERSSRHRSRSPRRRSERSDRDRDRDRDDRDRRHRRERSPERSSREKRSEKRPASPTGSTDSRRHSDRHADRSHRSSRHDDSRHSHRDHRDEAKDSPRRSVHDSPRRSVHDSPRRSTRDEEPRRAVTPADKAPETSRPAEAAKPAQPAKAPAAAPAPPASTGPPGETPEERKKRETRERLEAWKAKKAAQAAATSPAPASPAPASPKPPPEKPKKAGFAKAVTGQASKPTGVPARLGLPLAAKKTMLPSVAATEVKKLGRAKASEFMNDDDEDEAAAEMYKPEEMAAEDIAAVDEVPEGGEQGQDESDDEDLFGDDEGLDRTRAEERREQAALAASKAADDPDAPAPPTEEVAVAEPNGDIAMEEAPKVRKTRAAPDVETTQEKVDAMEVDEEPTDAPGEEDEEVDPLDAFMSNVTAEVKKVDEADTAKMGGGRTSTSLDGKKIHLTPLDMETEQAGEDEPVPEVDEAETVGLDAASIMALAQKKLKRRDVSTIDHAKIKYESFRKAFYHPPPEIEAMTTEEADLLRLSLDGIKIRGLDCPKPVTKWSHCGLNSLTLDVIKGLNYAAPTSIQAQAIPAIMSGRDVIGVAKTGSGKTIAFLLPLFRHIKDQRPLEPLEGPIGMIMTPTRELATQIFKECKPFLKAMNLRATCLYGGSPLKDNIAEIKRGVEIVVCTPGRMIELLTTNSGKIISMRRITYLVLDEADRMFDMGFEPQVTKIMSQIRPDRQTVLFSATFPKQMEALARKILKKPLEITVGGRSVVAAEIEQIVEIRDDDSKFKRLLELLGRYSNDDPEARILIFVDRQESADELNRELIQHHHVAQGLHGGKEQVDRDQTIADFKAGIIPIVIATSVAARGLDVKSLKLVVNYDAPNHMEDYVHRAGRTGRAGNKGTCVTFITPDQDRYAVDLLRALEASNAKVPDELRKMSEGFLLKVKSGAAKIGSGFGGKGLDRFDKDREATRKAERATFGEDEDKKEGGSDDEDAKEGGAAATPTMDVEIKRGPAPDFMRRGVVVTAEKPTGFDAMPIKPENLSAVERAKMVAANLNASLRAKRQEHNLNADDVRFGDGTGNDFHAVVPINDYPQKARWKVTNKETISSLVELTGASITNKGIFYDKGKEPEAGMPPKLHLLIEAVEESKVKRAILEIKRLLVEATTQALEAEQRNNIGGRYSL